MSAQTCNIAIGAARAGWSPTARWAVDLSEGGSIRVGALNLGVLIRDDCPPSLHVIVMLSLGKIQEEGDGEASEASLRKMVLLDTTAIPLVLLSSTERKAVLVLKQHAFVTVDEKDLVSIHSLTQLAVRGQTDTGDRRAIVECVVRAAKERLDSSTSTSLRPSLLAAGMLPPHAPPRRTLPRGGSSRDSWRRRTRHIGELVGPRVVEARRGADGVCWTK